MDVRVQDYLEDRLQSSADLDVLDTLLESVKSQHDLLKQQLDEARRDHAAASEHAQGHTAVLRRRGHEFEAAQADIDRRLRIVTQSDSGDDAARAFDASMARLHKLDVAAGYIELLKEVDALRAECTRQLGRSDDDAALVPYRKLQRLVTGLQPLQEAAEGAAPHLVDHVARQVAHLRETIRKSFADDLEKTLGKMSWPKVTETVPLALQQEWATNVTRLLDLQRQELEDREQTASISQPADEPPPLLPLAVMAHALEQRFIYHFSGNKPTNRLDKPEYFLSHTIDLISQYADFLQNAVQPLLVRHFRGSDLALTPAYIDATSALITALLPMLRRKLSSVASQVSGQPQLLSHLVHEVMAFDTTLQDSFAYSPASPSMPWRGLAYYMLDTCGHFQTWLSAERDFALSRYRSIVDSKEAGELEYDSVASDATKPTKAAIRVNDLLETVTERYRPLSSFSQKLRFLMDIQIAIFDEFHKHLHSGLEAYLTLTSSIGRRVQGVSREDSNELQGVKGLDRLCRIFGSADYLERAMRDWSDDIFFLELWDELQLRARSGPQIGRHVGGLQDIQRRTSAAAGTGGDPTATAIDDDRVQGALFDETAAAYHRLRVRSEAVMLETLTYNLREALRPYGRISTWASLSSNATAVSAELDAALRLLADYLGFLARALGRAALRRMARAVCQAVQAYLWESVLLRHTFSTAGAAQLAADVAALANAIDDRAGRGQARAGLRRIVDGVTLLSLPIRGRGRNGSVGAGDEGGEEEEDDAWGESEVPEAETNGAGEEGMGLFEVERLVFMDNESARYALQKLGLDGLSESDARATLERRVEIGS